MQQLIQDLANPVFGVSVQAFGRTGLEAVLPGFSVICLLYSAEIEEMRANGMSVFCLEEALGRKPEGKKNPTTLLSHPLTQRFIEQHQGKAAPVLLLYKSSSKLDNLAKKKNWILAANPFRLYKKLENKIFFKKALKKAGLKGVGSETERLGKLAFPQLIKQYPQGFVVQATDGGGGGGTCFIKKEEDWQRARNRLEKEHGLRASSKVLVAPFIKGYSPSITCCVTEQGILRLHPQLQLIDIAELSPQAKGDGVFLGHDWSEANLIEAELIQQMEEAGEKLGLFLKKIGFQGIFGVDFLVDFETQQIFPIEINPRLLGAFPVSTLVQLQNKEWPLILFHVLAFLGLNWEKYKIRLNELNQGFSKEKQGAHFFITVPFRPCQTKNGFKAGVWLVNKQGELSFQRPGYRLADLQHDQEFLIVDGVPVAGILISETDSFRLFRVVTRIGISSKMGTELNAMGKSIVGALLAWLDCGPPSAH